MLQIDLHVHTLFSLCGIHTVLELVERARVLGMKGLAITDHGLTIGGRLNSPFFERFQSPYPEVKVLKGVECNVLDKEGSIDLPEGYRQWLDIVLAGIHPNIQKGLSEKECTAMAVSAIDKNPSIDIISHPNDPHYPVDYNILARKAKEKGVALELNNSKVLYNRSSVENTMNLIEACRDQSCRMAVCSDTHAILELGTDESVRPLLERAKFPEELIVTSTAETTLAFIESRRKNKMHK